MSLATTLEHQRRRDAAEKEALSSISFQPWLLPNSCSLFIYFNISLVTQAAAHSLTPAGTSGRPCHPTLPCPAGCCRTAAWGRVRTPRVSPKPGSHQSQGLTRRGRSHGHLHGSAEGALSGKGWGTTDASSRLAQSQASQPDLKPAEPGKAIWVPTGFALLGRPRCAVILAVYLCLDAAISGKASSFPGQAQHPFK